MDDATGSDRRDQSSAEGKPPSSAAAPADPATDPPALPGPLIARDSVPGLLRKVRRIADLSQREMARAAKVARTTVGRVESGELMPSLGTLLRLLEVAGLGLVAVDAQGRVVHPMRVWDDTRDGADRQFPAHLDLIVDPRAGEWWADVYGLARPPETFHRDREWRDARRRRSQWEVRVAQFRNVPPPPDVDNDSRWRR